MFMQPKPEPFRARSMGLCLVGHHSILFNSGNSYRLGLKETSTLGRPRSP